MKADREALAAILNVDNIIIPNHKPLSMGIPISRTVAAQRIKVDPGIGRLTSNAFESRNNVDERYLKHHTHHYVRDFLTGWLCYVFVTYKNWNNCMHAKICAFIVRSTSAKIAARDPFRS